MTDIPPMQKTSDPLEDAHKYLVDYTENLRTTERLTIDGHVFVNWRDYEVLSLTMQDLIEYLQKLATRVAELEKK